MKEWFVNLVDTMGYAGIVLLMFIENVFPPIPSEVVMPGAGYGAEQGQLSFWGVCVAGTLGSVLGAIPIYYVGRWIGEERLKLWAGKWGKWMTVRPKDIERAMGWFDRHGKAAVLICRCIPGIRSLISIPAGICGMNMPQFLFYTAIGSGVWATFLAWIGRTMGQNYEQATTWIGWISFAVIAALLVALGAWILRRRARLRERQAAG